MNSKRATEDDPLNSNKIIVDDVKFLIDGIDNGVIANR